MGFSSIYTKTGKGQEEIATRAHRLPARVRALLIMADGKRTGTELLASSPAGAEGEQYLAMLLEQGFIAALAPPAAETAETRPASTPVPGEDIRSAKQIISHALLDLLGPDADLFTSKVDGARTASELTQLTENFRDTIRAAVGSKRADLFWSKVAAVIPATGAG